MKIENGKEMNPDEIRSVVASDYGRRVTKEPSGCGCGKAGKSALAGFSGYKPEEIATLPEAAVVNSFGCGNPVAGRRVTKEPSGCGCGKAGKSALAGFSGYKPEEIATLPEAAVVNSFGCGNPVALAGLKNGNVVLDLGSGAGIDLLLAARKVGASGHVIGIDMTDEMIEKARANIAKSGFKNIEVRKGLIEEMPVDDASVDWIISNCVINLSPEKARVFAEMARVMKPGGQILVSDIVGGGLSREVRENPAFYASCIGGVISEEAYLAGLRAVGFVDVSVRDRMHYDADQFYGFATSVVNDSDAKQGGTCSCGCQTDKVLIRQYASELAGKVWSAKVYARKPE